MPNQTEERVATVGAASPGNDGAGLVRALECRIGRAQFAVPTDSIERVIEYRTWPLPLAKTWIGGLGLYDGVPLISVALHRVVDTERNGAPVKGILLKVPSSPIAWALEVAEVFLFVRARLIEKRASDNGKLPRWTSIATTQDGRSLGYLDVPGMLADLADLEIGARS